jgi:hypothetical protein
VGVACGRRARLDRHFDEASAAFSNAHRRLLDQLATCSRSELATLNDAVDRAVEHLDHARAALDAHIKRHCCFTISGVTFLAKH